MTRSGFSSSESRVLKILGDKTMSIESIAKKFWDGTEDMPIDGGNKVAGYIRRINKKCEKYQYQWVIEGVGMGRAGRTVWKAKRSTT